MADGVARVLVDSAGNLVKVTQDGSDYKIEVIGKLRDAGGTIVNPAKEDGNLATLAGKDFATQTTLASLLSAFNAEDFASETTLLSVDGRLTTIDAVLDAIKDTDGIKKITDQLPAGTNEIGKVAQGTKAAGSGAWPNVLYDASGNPVGVVLDGTIYRIQADSKIAKGASALVHLDAIDTESGMGRLKSTLYSPDGDPIAFPSVSSNIKNDFVKYGGSASLLVDGSVTPVTFTYDADPTYDISIQEIKFTLVSNSVTFGSNYFGATSGPLPNGTIVKVTHDSVDTVLYVLNQNESFVNFASPGGFQWIVSSKDMMSAAYVIGGGLKLRAGTTDKVSVIVQDDIDSCGVYFRCFVKGNLLTG